MNLRNISQDYQPVAESEDPSDEKPEPKTRVSDAHAFVTLLNVLVFILSFLCLLTSIGFWRLGDSASCEKRPDIIYSPANEAVEPQTVRFDGALNATNIYKGAPNTELDSAWQDLFEYEPFLVTSEDLQKVNKTSIEVPTRPGYHLAKLAVHHQLHCLNYVRRFTRPEYYQVDESMFEITTIDHVDHCIDMLRQFIQCKADTTLITFDWHGGHGVGNPTRPNFCSTHPCNNFEKVTEWAKSRQFNATADLEAHPEAIQNMIEEILRQNGRLPEP